MQDTGLARGYAEYALRILARFCADKLLSASDPEREGLLKYGTYHEAKGLGVDEFMWVDYWFLDALDQVRGNVSGADG